MMNDIQSKPLRNNGFTKGCDCNHNTWLVKTDVLLSNTNICIIQHSCDLNIFVVHFIAYHHMIYIDNTFCWPSSRHENLGLIYEWRL